MDIKYNIDEQRLHELLNESEKHYIRWHRTSVKEWGYNIAEGGWSIPSQSPIEKAVDMFDMNGNYIQTFPSLTKANDKLGFTGPSIRNVCNHINNSSGGFLWAWHGESPIIPQGNKVYAYDDNDVFIKGYTNEFAASKELFGTSGFISSALRDKHRLAKRMYWRTYNVDQIPLSDFPKAIYAYDSDGNFVRGFVNLAKARILLETSSQAILAMLLDAKQLIRVIYGAKNILNT